MRIRLNNSGVGSANIDPAGGTMAAPLKLMSVPSGPMDAVTSTYVDTAATSFSGASVVGVFNAARLPTFTGAEVSSAGGGVFTLNNTGVVAGTYAKVVVDSKGRVTGGGTLVAGDIPSLSWAKLVDRPTTLAGYGITDVVSLSGGVMTGPLSLNLAPVANEQLANKAYVDGRVGGSGGSAFVVGDIIRRSSSVTPAGYLRANGAEVSKTTFAGLFAVLGDNNYIVRGNGRPWSDQYEFNDSSTANITGWTQRTSTPFTFSMGKMVVTKNKLFFLGGAVGSAPSTQFFKTTINSDGSLGAWTNDYTLPIGARNSNVFVLRDRLYLLGGYQSLNGGQSIANVYSVPINLDGSLGSWVVENPLPIGIFSFEIIVTTSRVYVIGGYNMAAGDLSTVYVSVIQPNGSLGSWATSSGLPFSVSGSSSFATRNRVYLFGGHSNGWSDRVFTAPVSSDGTIGIWSMGTPLPVVMADTSVVVTKNRVHLLGGRINGSGNSLNTQYINTINPDGTIGSWTTGSPLPYASYGSSVFLTKDTVYIVGGMINSNHSANVFSASLIGGLNDYSSIYSNTILFNDPSNFRLPDLTLKDRPGSFSYIKT